MEDSIMMKKTGILYLITDFSYGIDKIEEALMAGVDYVQLREKDISSREYLLRARLIKELTKKYKVPLIINDRIDIALLSEADGVHLGTDDVPISDARHILGEHAIIGATARNEIIAKQAQQDGADYLGSGAWFVTNTKKDAVPMEKDTYKRILKSVTIPSLAVGGINIDNCSVPLECGADGIAVSAGIMKPSDIKSTINIYRDAMKHIK